MIPSFLALVPWVVGSAVLPFPKPQVVSEIGVSVEDSVRVLFIGNSYTYYNELPSMLSTLASSESSLPQVFAEAVVVGGATLERHWEEGTATEAIRGGDWDFVVLQEQSLRPVNDPERMFEFARKFATEIRSAGADPVLFLTWARDGRPEMQVLLDRSYLTLGRELGAQVVPAGPAWEIALELSPEIPLHMDDGSHPTPTGTYLAACVFFGVLVDETTPCPPIENGEISPSDAAVARRAASRVLSGGH